jgi:hypothetical protein
MGDLQQWLDSLEDEIDNDNTPVPPVSTWWKTAPADFGLSLDENEVK